MDISLPIWVSLRKLSFDLKRLKKIPENLSSELKNKIEAINKELEEINVAS